MGEIYIWADEQGQKRDYDHIRDILLEQDAAFMEYDKKKISYLREENGFGLLISTLEADIRQGNLDVYVDGHIENLPELQKELQLSQTSSTEAVVRTAYERWEEEFPSRLKGDYAIVLRDKSKEQFICARAPFGVKAMYYYLDESACVFATSQQKVLALKLLPVKFNWEYVAEYFANHEMSVVKETPYCNWRVVLPGESLIIRKNDARRIALWQPRVLKHTLGERETIERFRDLFVDSVKRKICDNVFPDYNFFLSGGLDSSSIACAFLHIPDFDPKRLHIYHDCHKEEIDEYEMLKRGIDDEAILAQKICERLGTPLHLRNGSQKNNLLKDFEPLQDFADPDINILYGHSKWTGEKIPNYPFITGFGGDQVAGRVVNIDRNHQINQSQYDMHMYEIYEECLKPEFVARYSLRDRVNGKEGLGNYKTESQNIQWKTIFQNGQGVGRQQGYRFEIVSPFHDIDLVEYCVNLPDKYFNRKGVGKYILRKAFEKDLPPEIFIRKGKGTHVHTAYEGIKDNWGSIEKRYDHLKLAEYGIVDKEKFIGMMQRFRYGTEYHSLHVMKLLALELWLESKQSVFEGVMG